ncbi:hypothetical protein [Bacillus cereus]|nr:hypothetical protein [Bacillus cereus]
MQKANHEAGKQLYKSARIIEGNKRTYRSERKMQEELYNYSG